MSLCQRCERPAYSFVGDICEDCDNDLHHYDDEDYDRD